MKRLCSYLLTVQWRLRRTFVNLFCISPCFRLNRGRVWRGTIWNKRSMPSGPLQGERGGGEGEETINALLRHYITRPRSTERWLF